MVRAFDIFQMLDVLQDLRGAMSQQVSLLFCPFLLHPTCQGDLYVGRCPTTDCLEMQMCNLVTPAVHVTSRMGLLSAKSIPEYLIVYMPIFPAKQ